jgi:uncharacterized protein YyaL (SSP411 family)
LQNAQRLVVEAKRKKPQKCPKRYTEKSKRTLMRHKKHGDDFRNQGFYFMFEFMERMDAKKKANINQHMETVTEIVQESKESISEKIKQDLEKSVPEEIEADTLMSKHVGQMSRRKFLMHQNLQMRPACSHQRRERRGHK